MYVVIDGGGKVGSYLARRLAENGNDVVIIEKRAEVVDKLLTELPKSTMIIQGDGCDVVYQDDAGVSRADVFVAATGDDDDNLVACQLARTAFGVPRTISRVNNPKNERIFNKLGIEAISSTNIIVRMIEEEATMGDIKTLINLRKGALAIVEIDLPDKPCPACGKPVSDLKLPSECVLVAVVRGDEVITVSGGTVIERRDTVIAFTRVDQERSLRRALVGS